MMNLPELSHLSHFLKAILSIGASMTAWLGNTVAQTMAPDQSWAQWLDRYGLPMVMLALALCAVVQLYKALRESEKARIVEAKTSTDLYLKEQQAAMASREKLTDAMNFQARAFDTQSEAIKELARKAVCPYQNEQE